MDYKKPSLTVDGIVHIRENDNDKIVLIKRKNDPFKNHWALPGGFVEYGEKVEDAVIREVLEETNIKTKIKCLLNVYSDPNRDPRGHTVSVVYVLKPIDNIDYNLKGMDDACDAKVFNIKDCINLNLAFDHRNIIDDFISCLENPKSVKICSKNMNW